MRNSYTDTIPISVQIIVCAIKEHGNMEQPEFMTKKLMPHEVEGLKQVLFGRRQQIYDDGSIHDVEKAIRHLQRQLIGFFVEAHLDWGKETKIRFNPTGDTSVDVAAVNIKSPTGSNQTSA
jgi:phospholipase D1/2